MFHNPFVRFTTVLRLLLLFIATAAMGQGKAKRNLSPADYHLWHELQLDKLSPDGEWVSYRLNYEAADTLFVTSTTSKNRIAFAGGTKSSFSKYYFACLGLDNQLKVLDLKRQKSRSYDAVYSYQLTDDYLIYYVKDKELGTLTLCKADGTVLRVINGVTNYVVSPTNQELLLSRKNENNYHVSYMKLDRWNKAIIVHENDAISYQKLTWSQDGDCFAFFSVQGSNSSVFYYDIKNKKLAVLDCSRTKCFSESRVIQINQKITFSDDRKSLFFNIQQAGHGKETSENSVQVWNAADQYIYPSAVEVAGFSGTMRQVMWEVETGRFTEVNGMPLPFGGAIGNKKYALSYNPMTYEPYTEVSAPIDIYLTELASGKQKLLLEKHSGSEFYTMGSPEGNYVVYYKSPKWYAYDIEKELHIDLTIGTDVSFANTESDRLGEPEAYHCAGWTEGDRSFLMYDKFDVWEVFPNGSAPKRLTNGREHQIIYRIVIQNEEERSSTQNRVRTTGKFNLKKPILLSAVSEDSSQSGYYTFSYTRGLEQMVYLNKRTRNVIQNEKRDMCVYISERYDSPPELNVASKGSTKSIFKSNRQHDDFLWGKTKVIPYLSPSGKKLSGILYYPAGFDENKRYPMVVHIYQKQSKQLHVYWIPTNYNDTGFNIANLSSHGYFIFLPDISYETEYAVGQSALGCVDSALKSVSKVPYIDMSRVGLIGHSFGGYQTDYIISQSTLFACAVAGAAMTNFISANLAVNKGVNRPNFFVVETGQPRIGGSLSEKKDLYIDNSPVFFAHQISTPLLSWTGAEDTQVESRQSIELYMALRRLGKEHVMLIYPKESHGIIQKSNMLDLTFKIEDWFAHYLKNKPASLWMQPK